MTCKRHNHCTPHRLMGLKLTTWRDINIFLLIVMLFGSFFHQIALRDHDLGIRLVSPLAIRAYAEEVGYTVPPLAPIVERTQVMGLIRKIWGKDAKVGLAIARCESGYRVAAVNHNTNKTDDQGVYQVNTVHQMPDMFNPTANILYAYSIYQSQGTTPWDSSKTCWGSGVNE